jgi:hypothetical protein
MITAMEQALARIELLYGMKPDAIHWEMFKNDCMEKEKEQIENTFADGFVEGVETQKSGEQLLFPEQYYNQTYNQNK